MNVHLLDREPDYLSIARARVRHAFGALFARTNESKGLLTTQGGVHC